MQPLLPVIHDGPPASPVIYIDDEIPLDQLVGLGEEGFPQVGSPVQPEQLEHVEEDIQMIDGQQQVGINENQQLLQQHDMDIQMNHNQQSDGSGNMNADVVQELQNIGEIQAEPEEHNIVIGMALMSTLQQDVTFRILEDDRAKEAANLWDKSFSKGNSNDLIKIPANWSCFLPQCSYPQKLSIGPLNFCLHLQLLKSSVIRVISPL